MMSAPWCSWMMLALFLCMVLAEITQPGVLLQSPSALVVRTERDYKESSANFMGQLFITLFRIGTASMAMCLCWCPADHAPLEAFGVVCGILVAVLLVKMVCNVLLDYAFSLTRRFGDGYELYGNIATLSAAVLYVALLVLLRIPDVTVARWTAGAIAGLFILLWMYRAARAYVRSLSAVLYLVVYIVTLEVLPMAAFIYLSAQTIAIL